MAGMLPVSYAAMLAVVDPNAADSSIAVPTTATAPATSKKAVAAARRRKRKTATTTDTTAATPSPRTGDTASECDTSGTTTATTAAATSRHSHSSDEEKKEKNRNSVRRSYYRKIETLGELRVHADDLRQQYSAMLERWETRFLPPPTTGVDTATAPGATKSALLLRYLQLSRLRDELWTENQQLQDAFEDREKSAFRLQRLFDVNYQLMDHSAHASSRNPETVRFPSPALIMDEMSFDAFAGYATDALAQVEAFEARRSHMTSTNQVLGWKSSHEVERDMFRFYFDKTFDMRHDSSISARSVSQSAWAILTSPRRHAELYARTLHVQFHVMQHFDADRYVLYRTMEKEGEDSITTALLCMTRIVRDDRGGCLIICKGLKKAEHRLFLESMSEYTLHKKKIWRESMYWLSIDTVDGTGLRIAHGGIMKHMGERSPSFWLFENLLIALRWETKLGLERKGATNGVAAASMAADSVKHEEVDATAL